MIINNNKITDIGVKYLGLGLSKLINLNNLILDLRKYFYYLLDNKTIKFNFYN